MIRSEQTLPLTRLYLISSVIFEIFNFYTIFTTGSPKLVEIFVSTLQNTSVNACCHLHVEIGNPPGVKQYMKSDLKFLITWSGVFRLLNCVATIKLFYMLSEYSISTAVLKNLFCCLLFHKQNS